jgi:hypothetical protein
MATAARNAVRDCGEKSTGQRIDRTVTDPMLRLAVRVGVIPDAGTLEPVIPLNI